MRTFHLRTKVVKDVVVLLPKGHLDAHQVARFEKEIVRLIRDRMVKIVIDGQELSYITSAGMGIIMGYIEEVREKGGDIKLCSLSDRVYETFDLIGFTREFDFHPNEESAIEAFTKLPAHS